MKILQYIKPICAYITKQKLSVINSGLHVFQPLMVNGASPDGKVQIHNNPYFDEIKCPFKWRNDTIIGIRSIVRQLYSPTAR